MKSFPFQFEGKEYHLRKLTQEAKEALTDRLTAGRIKQVQRMYRAGLLDAAEFVDAKQAAFVKFGTEAFVAELVDPENRKAFIRAILVESVDDATIARLVLEERKPESDMRSAIDRMAEDDDPKAPTPPVSVLTPTGGAPSS